MSPWDNLIKLFSEHGESTFVLTMILLGIWLYRKWDSSRRNELAGLPSRDFIKLELATQQKEILEIIGRKYIDRDFLTEYNDRHREIERRIGAIENRIKNV